MKHAQFSRRDFIRRSATAAGTGLVAGAWTLDPDSSSAYAALASGTPRPAAPSDTIRFGIIGVGMQGSGLLATSIRLPGVECVAACDLYDGRHELAREIVGKPIPTTRRYHELLDNKDIDCLIAAVPDHWHEQVVVDACNAGKDIYCEKPMTHHVPEGFQMIAAEQKNHRIVQIGSQRRSSIIYAKAKEMVEQGAIGDVCLVEGTLGRNDPCGAWVYPPPPDLSPENLDWETWLGKTPKRPFDPIRFARWRAYRDYGEGIPGDLFVHLITGIHYILGVTAPPERALSTGGQFVWKDHDRDVPDCLSTFFEYPKFRALIRVTLNTEAPEITRLMGTHGVLEIKDDVLTWSPQDEKEHDPCYYAHSYPRRLWNEYAQKFHEEHDAQPGTARVVEGSTFSPPPGYNEDREHLWNYFQSVRTRQPSVEDATFGNHTAIACHMANYSYFQKTIAVWDAAGKKITG